MSSRQSNINISNLSNNSNCSNLSNFSNVPNISNVPNLSNVSNIANENNLINTFPSNDTIIKLHMDDMDTSITRSAKYNISPIIRRTPNTKADIIIQKIYTNRKNVIRNFSSTKSTINLNDNNLYNYDNTDTSIKNKKPTDNNTIISDQCDISNNDNSDTPDKSTTPTSDNSVDGDSFNKLDKKRRKYYRTLKFKKTIDTNQIIANSTNNQSPNSSPRDISNDLWNDNVENYHLEFQKLCKEESGKYKYLSHRNEIVSNLLKFILLISGCFTFTLSISIPNSLFMNTTTTVSSCLTAIITSVTGFFQFDKKSEIQYNIYRELDKLYNTISLELLKPSYMRADPYEFILSLRNRRDELLKTLQKNR
jgi:hypothetical protein|uniref:SMODS and SLOG-associating 2TM effector domain-containing protein n=1 Tax=viral metagenome TaxID=1070528 RepID=A0A6C0I6F1_9ZZZZ